MSTWYKYKTEWAAPHQFSQSIHKFIPFLYPLQTIMASNRLYALILVVAVLVPFFAMESRAESDKTDQEIMKELAPKKHDNEIGIMVRTESTKGI